MRSPRGVFVERTVCGVVEISVITSASKRTLVLWLEPEDFDERIVRRLERWLDRKDPQLRVVSM